MKSIRVKRMKELCETCGLTEELICHFIELDWLRPLDAENQIFDDEDVARVQLIHVLQEEMGVNEEAIPIILRLVDQINLIHLKMRSLE